MKEVRPLPLPSSFLSVPISEPQNFGYVRLHSFSKIDGTAWACPSSYWFSLVLKKNSDRHPPYRLLGLGLAAVVICLIEPGKTGRSQFPAAAKARASFHSFSDVVFSLISSGLIRLSTLPAAVADHSLHRCHPARLADSVYIFLYHGTSGLSQPLVYSQWLPAFTGNIHRLYRHPDWQ